MNQNLINKLKSINILDYDYKMFEGISFTKNEISEIINNYTNVKKEKLKINDPSILRKVYLVLSYYIIKSGKGGFQDSKLFFKACRYSIEICKIFNDHLNSNNILRTYCKCVKKNNRGSWYFLDSIEIYGKRFPYYFLKKPEKLIEKIKLFHERTKQKIDRIDYTLEKLLEDYIDKYKDKSLSGDSLKVFLDKIIYTEEVQLGDNFKTGLIKFKRLINGDVSQDDFDWEPRYIGKSKSDVDLDDIDQVEFKKEINSEHIGLNIIESTEDFNYTARTKTVIILGDPKVPKNVIIGIAKKFDLRNLKFYDFNEVKSEYLNLNYNSNNLGIIVCSIPHKTKNNNGHNSIVSRLERESGLPDVIVFKNPDGTISASKSKFEKAFKHLSNKYCRIFS